MAVDERSRRMLYDRLEEVLGVGQGDILMQYLPPVGWADLATRRDIDGLAAATKHDIDGLAAATKRDIDGLAASTKADFDGLAASTTHDLTELSQRMDHRFERVDDHFAQQTAEITAAFRGEINAAMTLQVRQTVFAIIGVLLAVAALVAAVLGLG